MNGHKVDPFTAKLYKTAAAAEHKLYFFKSAAETAAAAEHTETSIKSNFSVCCVRQPTYPQPTTPTLSLPLSTLVTVTTLLPMLQNYPYHPHHHIVTNGSNPSHTGPALTYIHITLPQ